MRSLQKIFEKNENFEQSQSAENSEKRDPLGFLTFVLLQNIKKLKGGLFEDILKISKKSLTKPKSLIVPKKSENLLLRNTCKKISKDG